MINYITDGFYPLTAFAGILFAFFATCLFTAKLQKFLPKDMGREFAHDGSLSAGKPRGAGIIFILVFTAAALLFCELNVEIVIYLALVVVEMLTGYLDDASDKPWGEYKKGILDLIVAVIVAVTFIHFHTTTVELAILGITFTIPPDRDPCMGIHQCDELFRRCGRSVRYAYDRDFGDNLCDRLHQGSWGKHPVPDPALCGMSAWISVV